VPFSPTNPPITLPPACTIPSLVTVAAPCNQMLLTYVLDLQRKPPYPRRLPGKWPLDSGLAWNQSARGK